MNIETSQSAWSDENDVVLVIDGVVRQVYFNTLSQDVIYSGPGQLIEVPHGSVYLEWTYDEATGQFTPPPPPLRDYTIDAYEALMKSDITVLRCIEHSVTLPSAWVTYRAALRPIAGGVTPNTPLPTRPAYPAST